MWYALLIIILIFGGLIGYRYYDKPIPTSENFLPINTNIDPIQLEQEGLGQIAMDFKNGSIKIHPLAEYSISGKLLSKKKYGSTWNAKIAPYDFAIGWGDLLREDLKKIINYNQWGRFYFFKYELNPPFKDKYIVEHSSNNHIIPATENLKKLLFHIKEDDIITMEGFLVNIRGKMGNNFVNWKTSLKRKDTGNGSCELFYVTRIKHDYKIYE